MHSCPRQPGDSLQQPTVQLILTNDDGIGEPGLDALEELARAHGETLVVAPAVQQSGVGHAVTTSRPIQLHEHGSTRYAIEGTPADCARVALRSLSEPTASGRWLLAGINQGANLGVDTYVSGTVAAAREAAILGCPAIAISQYVARHRSPDWRRCVERARPILEVLLAREPAPGSFWNVNLPHPADESADCAVVFCEVDPSPTAVRYRRSGDYLEWHADYHQRPRRPGHDIDVCFGGRIAVTRIAVAPATGGSL